MTETQQRFLREIAERVGADRVVELHLFPTIRQGGMESGVAVVAARADSPAVPDERSAVLDETPPGDGVPDDAVPDDAVPDDAAAALESADTVDATLVDDDGELDESPYAESPETTIAVEVEATVSEATLVDDDGGDASPMPERLIVYSAHFRLAIKGPDRGKWLCEVVAEADAPLDTVDAVVRGVQRRAGEVGEAERFTGDAFRAALDSPAWTSRA